MSRTILITGIGRGMGLETVKAHLALGDRIFGLTHSITDGLKAVMEGNENLTVFPCELTNHEEVEAVFRQINEPVDILYNVAAIYSIPQMVGLDETDLEICRKMYEVNALGTLRVLKFAKHLLHEGSVVMNVSSEAGSIGQAERKGEYGYCMSKAAVNMASKLFANEMEGTGIRVFCYHPGWMRTQMGGIRAEQSSHSISAEEGAERMMKVTLHPEQIPADVMYLDYKGNYLPW